MSTELIVTDEALAVPISAVDSPLTTEEQRLAHMLMTVTRQEDLRVSIPDTVSDDELIRCINSAMKVSVAMLRAHRYIQPVIGRLINIMADRPEVIKHFGAKDINEFCTVTCPKMFGINRSEAFNARRIVQLFPDITPDDYAKVGTSKLKAIGRAVEWEATPEIYELKKFAEEHTFDQLVMHMAESGMDVEGLQFEQLTTRVTKETRRRWNLFITGDVARDYCESAAHDRIVTRMLDELEADWTAVVEMQRRSAAEDVKQGEYDNF